MSKFEEEFTKYTDQNEKLGLGLSHDLISGVAKSLGPSIYNEDSSRVSASDPEELARVKNNFLIGKLGLEDSSDLDAAIKAVMEKMGSSNRDKFRANVYACLAQHFGKEDMFM
jgi:hypothetical protein